MLALTSGTRIFLVVAPVDLRLQFRRSHGARANGPGAAGARGGLFAFTNRRRNRLRLLWWDGTGLWIATKRLERGALTWPAGEGTSVKLRPEQLSALISGLEVREKNGGIGADAR